jgi:hypothetical protein
LDNLFGLVKELAATSPVAAYFELHGLRCYLVRQHVGKFMDSKPGLPIPWVQTPDVQIRNRLVALADENNKHQNPTRAELGFCFEVRINRMQSASLK